MLQRLRLIMFPVVLALLLVLVYSRRDELLSLRIVSFAWVGVCLLANIGIVLINAILFGEVVRALKLPIDRPTVFRTSILGAALNSVLPQAGNLSRAFFFKAAGTMKLSDFGSSLVAVTLISGLCSCAILVPSCAILAFDNSRADFRLLVALTLAVTAGLSLLAAVPHSLFERLKLGASVRGWFIIRSQRDAVLRITFWCLGHHACQVVILWSAYVALGAHTDGLALLVSTNVGLVSTMVSLTPGSLGIYEGVLVATAGILSLPVALTLAASLLGRALSWVALLGLSAVVSIPPLTHHQTNDSRADRKKFPETPKVRSDE